MGPVKVKNPHGAYCPLNAQNLAKIGCSPQQAIGAIEHWFKKANESAKKGTAEINQTTLNESDSTQQSYRCQLKENGQRQVTESTPEENTNISGFQCEFRETDPGSALASGKCTYDLKWLGETVGYYSCKITDPTNCSDVIKTEYENKTGASARGKEVEIKDGENRKDELKAKKCEVKESGADPRKFKFKDDPKGEIWCTFDKKDPKEIKCEFLTPCQVEIKERLGAKEHSVGVETGISYQGGVGPISLPKECKAREDSTTEPRKFTSTDANAKNGEIWCASSTETDTKKIECKFFTPCEVAVREALGSQVSDGLSVKFGEHKPVQDNLTGKNCKNEGGATANGEATLAFSFSSEKESHHDGKLFCKRGGTGKIDCTFSPNCAYTVKDALKEELKKAIIPENLDLNEVGCKKTDGKRSATAQTFRITKIGGNEADGGEISCHKEGGKITCEQLSPCEIEVKNAFTFTPPIIFGGQVTDPDWSGENVGLDGKVCSNVGKEGEGTVFSFTSKDEMRVGSEFSCKKDNSEIKCSLLPERCQIEGMKKVGKKPLRCNKKNKSISFSGGYFQERMECEPINETTFHDKHRTHCAINVTIGEVNETYVCEKEKTNLEGKEEWCHKIPPPVAKNCFENGLEFEKDSPCKNHTGSISIPKELFTNFGTKGKCNKSEDGRTGETGQCKMGIRIGDKNKTTYLCVEEKLKEDIKELCKKLAIPGMQNEINSGKKEETVRLLFETEENTGGGAVETAVEERRFSVLALPPPEPWDLEGGDFASFYYSSFSLILLALF